MLYNIFLPLLPFCLVTTISPMLHTHSFTYHPRHVMLLSQYFSFPLSVPFHQCSIPIFPYYWRYAMLPIDSFLNAFERLFKHRLLCQSELCRSAHTVHLCVLYASRYEQLVSVMETHCLYCEIGTGLMNIAQKFRLHRDNAECCWRRIFIPVSYFLFVNCSGCYPMKEVSLYWGIQTVSVCLSVLT
jgi:hypothetical protein